MDSLEAWIDFRRGEAYTPPAAKRCHFCGNPCTGDTTDNETGDAVCDNPEACPALA